MASADNDRSTLDALNAAMQRWVDLQFNDVTNSAIGLMDHILGNDLPELRRVRWYAQHDAVHAETLWKRYIDNAELEGELKETVLDFYVTGASFIWLNTPIATANYNSFIDHLANNLSWMQRCALVPPDIKEHVGTVEQIKGFLTGNHWALFLVLLSMLDLK